MQAGNSSRGTDVGEDVEVDTGSNHSEVRVCGTWGHVYPLMKQAYPEKRPYARRSGPFMPGMKAERGGIQRKHSP